MILIHKDTDFQAIITDSSAMKYDIAVDLRDASIYVMDIPLTADYMKIGEIDTARIRDSKTAIKRSSAHLRHLVFSYRCSSMISYAVAKAKYGAKGVKPKAFVCELKEHVCGIKGSPALFYDRNVLDYYKMNKDKFKKTK